MEPTPLCTPYVTSYAWTLAACVIYLIGFCSSQEANVGVVTYPIVKDLDVSSNDTISFECLSDNDQLSRIFYNGTDEGNLDKCERVKPEKFSLDDQTTLWRTRLSCPLYLTGTFWCNDRVGSTPTSVYFRKSNELKKEVPPDHDFVSADSKNQLSSKGPPTGSFLTAVAIFCGCAVFAAVACTIVFVRERRQKTLEQKKLEKDEDEHKMLSAHHR